ncbi:MAG: hypothetical protein WHS46_02780 [Desulfosoma sp.]
MSESAHLASESEIKQWITQIAEQILREKAEEILAEKIAVFVKENEQRAREFSLMERVIRVEEELKALKEIQIAHFNASEKRFEALQREMTARFEAVDKRFVLVQWTMGLGFSLMIAFMGALKLWP